ncbi:hypothetical protein FRC03_003952 [Tulasnella sp. 419]|nr:hypothetical protein FRC03_003952 [Tulasnella sp. 419]
MSHSSIEDPVWDTVSRATGQNVQQSHRDSEVYDDGHHARRVQSNETFYTNRTGSDPFGDDKYGVRNSRYGEIFQRQSNAPASARNSVASNMRPRSMRGHGSGDEDEDMSPADDWEAMYQDAPEELHRSRSQSQLNTLHEAQEGSDGEEEEGYEEYVQPSRTRHVPPTPASFAGATHLSLDPAASPGPAFKKYLPPAGRASRILDTPRIGQLARIRRAVGSEQPTSTNDSDEGGGGDGTWHSATPAMMPLPDIAEGDSPPQTPSHHEESFGQPTPLIRPRYIEAPTLRIVSKYAKSKSSTKAPSVASRRKDAARSVAESTPRASEHRRLPGSPSVDLSNLPTPKPSKSKLRADSRASSVATPIPTTNVPIPPTLNTVNAPLPQSTKTTTTVLPPQVPNSPLPQNKKSNSKNLPAKSTNTPILASPKHSTRSARAKGHSKRSSYETTAQDERSDTSQSESSFKSVSEGGTGGMQSSSFGTPFTLKLKEWRNGPQEVQAPLYGGHAEEGNTLTPDERIFWYDSALDKEEFEEFENDVRGTTLEMELGQFAFSKTFDEDGGKGAVFIPGTARDVNQGCQGASLETFWMTFAEAKLVNYRSLLRRIARYDPEHEFIVILYSIPPGVTRIIELCPLIFTYDLVSALWRKRWKAGHPFKHNALVNEDYALTSSDGSERTSSGEETEKGAESSDNDGSIVGEF